MDGTLHLILSILLMLLLGCQGKENMLSTIRKKGNSQREEMKIRLTELESIKATSFWQEYLL